jgi:hypothetical protein
MSLAVSGDECQSWTDHALLLARDTEIGKPILAPPVGPQLQRFNCRTGRARQTNSPGAER